MKIKKLLIILSLILIINGIILLIYPKLSNYIVSQNQKELIKQYDETLESNEFDSTKIEEELKSADFYNDNLAGDPVHDPFVEESGYALPSNYLNILNVNEGIIGYIEIPKISVKLPIYHGTSKEVLEKGVGHIESTAFPIGGESRHSVLIGHRGLPNAKLFTDLDKLKIGDYIYITVLNKTLTYQVYDTEVIEPDDLEKIQIVKGKDLITLITCTPYGINTHRLLVHSERVEDNNFEEEKNNIINNYDNKDNYKNIIFLLIIGTIVLIIILLFIKKLLKNRKSKIIS